MAVIQTHIDEGGGKRHELRHLDRFPMNTSYPDQVDKILDLVAKLSREAETWVVADKTGVGKPVTDYLTKRGLKNLVCITITGGNAVTRERGGYSVPKRDLVSNLTLTLQSGRLQFAGNLPMVQVMIDELKGFRVKVNPKTGHDSYEAWREQDHDDLVLALCMSAWAGEHLRQRGRIRGFDYAGKQIY